MKTSIDKPESKATKHTPAPWNVNGGMRQGIKTVYAASGSVAEMTDSKAHSNEEQEANARLIAAAPELLEALNKLVRRAEINGWASPPDIVHAVKVIAKAKGE